MAGERVDGNDLVALLAALRRAVELARTERVPLLVEAHTYRMQAHTNADDDTRYREREEVREWAEKDPLVRMEAYMRGTGLLTDEVAEQIRTRSEEVAAALREAMNAEIDPDPLELFDHVYTQRTPQLEEQRRRLEQELAAEAQTETEDRSGR